MIITPYLTSSPSRLSDEDIREIDRIFATRSAHAYATGHRELRTERAVRKPERVLHAVMRFPVGL